MFMKYSVVFSSVFSSVFSGVFLAAFLAAWGAGGFSPARAAPCAAAVARFAGQDICAEDIEPAPEARAAMEEQYRAQGRDPADALAERNLLRLRDVLWSRALDRKFGKGGRDPAPEDVKAYKEAFRRTLEKSHENGLRLRDLVKSLLAGHAYSPENTEKLKDILASLEKGITYYEQRESHRRTMPPEFQDMLDGAEDEIARAAVAEWMTNRLLYGAYGGRIAWRRAGRPEPVDAYRAFVAYIRGEGGLVILDPAYKDVFGQVERYLKNHPGTLPPAGEDAFGREKWGAFSENGGRFEEMEAILRAIPPLEAPPGPPAGEKKEGP